MRRRLGLVSIALGASFAFAPAASGQTCGRNVPHTTGTWVTLPYQMPVNPISATLLSTGRYAGQVLIVAGSENDASNNSKGSESYRAAVWNPAATSGSGIWVWELEYDVFCSGTAVLRDGRSLIVGGTSDYSFKGDNRASFFDPATGGVVQSQSMVDGRWYASATALGDGRIMTFSGLGLGGGTNNSVEIYSLENAGAGWTPPSTAPFTPPLYPREFVLPNGTVFYTGHGSGGSNGNGWFFDPGAESWTISAATTRDRTYGSAVLLPLLPPSYTPKVMSFGGGNPATSTTETIDLSASSPAWKAGPSMSTGRIEMNAVLLPNGKVLAEGGSVNNESPDTPGKTADLFDPASNTMSSAGAAAYSRLYHSTALLLPDARVMSMGSNPGNRGSYAPAIEIWTPPYLFDANDHLITNRPAITSAAPGVLGYGASFTVDYTSSSPISSAVLVRPGSTTHAFDMEQRLVGLCGPSPQPACGPGGGSLTLTTPPDGNVAPPGYYMLFLLDGSGVPSVAQFIQVSDHITTPPKGAISSPAADVTITAGGSVTFGTTTTAAQYSWVFPGGSPATSTAQNPGAVKFSTPGEYTASLTVIDTAGNTDASPPTRTVTVNPPTPDFSIAVSPPAQAVVPGQSASYTVTVTPVSGFTGSVSLSVGSESGFPSGITSGGFSPASIAGSGSSTLTMNTTTSAVPYALSLTITGTSGTLAHTSSTTLLVTLAPPASLTATAGSGQVALSWPASVGANGYSVQRSSVSGGPYEAIGCPTTTSFTDSGVTNGTTYSYVVSATYAGGPDAGGASAASAEANATPQGTVGVPPAPTALTATAGNAQVALSWTASTGATSYNVKRGTTSGGPYATIASPTAASYTDTGLTNGTTYYYVVSAVDSAGESPNSSQASATPQSSGSGAAPIRVNAGGSAFVDASGKAWSADSNFNTGTAATAASTWTLANAPLYSTERWDPSTAPELEYSFPLANGTYTVNLHFAEIYSGTACVGCRQFDVLLNGTKVLDHLDIYAQVGFMQPLVKSFTVNVANAVLNVDFVHEIENPKISGIEIIPGSAPPPVRTTFGNGGNPWAVSATGTTRIQAENYDTGGEGVAYHDTTAGNTGGQYRQDDVDIEAASGGGFNVGWIVAGEWLEYTVNVAAAARYDLRLHLARQPTGTSAMDVLFGGVDATGPITVPSTGGWQTWTDVTVPGVSLSAGQQVMRLAMTGSDFNLDWIEISPSATTTNQTLTVTTSGTGSGTVTSSPAGISCPGQCSASYASGTSVTLTATPASGSTFGGWGGACSGTGTCTVAMTSAVAVGAAFASSTTTTYTLTVSTSGTGNGTVTSSPAGISCPGQCSASYASGTSVTLTAAPASGSTFSGWGGACSGTGTCTVTMNAAASVSATFNTSPTTPPSAPTGLTAGSGKRKIMLHWTQSTSAGITQNQVYRRLGSGTYPSTPLATVAATTSYNDGGLTSGTTYCYQVTAVSSSGTSARSNEACAAAK